MSKLVAFCSVLLLLLTACGGGGGGGGLVPVAPGSTAEQVQAQQAFEACGPMDVAIWQDAVNQPVALFEAGSPIPPSMFVWTSNTLDAFLLWQTNLDLDIPIDFEILSQFEDAQGEPYMPVPLATWVQIASGDLLDLYTVTEAMPAGGRLAHTITTPEQQPGEPALIGSVVHTLGTAGMFVTSSGSFAVTHDAGCQTAFQWDALTLPTPAYLGVPLAGSVEIDVVNPLGEHVSGRLTYTGSPTTADLELWLDGGRVWRYAYDLATGTITPQP